MPWEKVPPKRLYAETATLHEERIFLSGEFIKRKGLEKYEFVELFRDPALRRIGFKFCGAQTRDTHKLLKKRRGRGSTIKVQLQQKIPWLADVLDLPVTERRFLIETDETVPSPTEGARYYIFVGYRFHPEKREFASQGDYPRRPGVYRLFKGTEIVRIGESDDLERRLKEHFGSYRDEVDEYDFAEIEDQAARKSEEKRLLEEFRDAYGRLPKLNSIVS